MEVEHEQRSDRSVRLVGSAGEVIDSSALSFLTAQALEEKRKEEEDQANKREELLQDEEHVKLLTEVHSSATGSVTSTTWFTPYRHLLRSVRC